MSVDVAATQSLSSRVAVEIKVLMVRRNISGRRLAQLLDVSQTWLSTRLTGATPIDMNDLDRICVALGVNPVQVMTAATDTDRYHASGKRPKPTSMRTPLSAVMGSRRHQAGAVATLPPGLAVATVGCGEPPISRPAILPRRKTA